MEQFFSLEYGIGGICVLLVFHALIKIADIFWQQRQKQDHVSEETIKALTKAVLDNTTAAQHLDMRLGRLEQAVLDLPKFKKDIRRFYAAIKHLAGDDWPKIRDEIMKDELAT